MRTIDVGHQHNEGHGYVYIHARREHSINGKCFSAILVFAPSAHSLSRHRTTALLFGSFEQFARTAAARMLSSWMRLVFSVRTHQSLITMGSWIESYVSERTSSEHRVLAHSLGECPRSRSSREPVCAERLLAWSRSVRCV